MPELTGVDLSTATAATRVASGMSGLFGAGYEVTRCSDSSYTTMCATNQGLAAAATSSLERRWALYGRSDVCRHVWLELRKLAQLQLRWVR